MIKPDRVLGIVKKQGYEIRKEEYCGESVGIPDGKCIKYDRINIKVKIKVC